MVPVYTLIIDGAPFSYSAETAPSIGELVTLDAGATVVRVLRSSDGGRVYAAEVAVRDGS